MAKNEVSKSFTSPAVAENAPPEKEEKYPFATLAVELPSLGKVYPKGHALHNQKEVEMKYMTAKEEDILTSPSLLRTGKAINKVIQSCLVKPLDLDKVLVGDRNALLLALRISGYGSEYKVSMVSADTGETFDHTFDLSTVEYKYLDEKPEEEYSNLFQVELPITKTTILFKLLTVGDEARLTSEQDQLKKVMHIEKNITTRLTKQIVAINSDNDPMHIKQFVENMPVKDSREFRTAYAVIMPDVDMTQWITDPTSGEEVKVDIPVGIEFLWPSAER